MNARSLKWGRLSSGLVLVALVLGLIIPTATAGAVGELTIPISQLEPSWTAAGGGGVWAGYCGPPSYDCVSPGATAVYDTRGAGIIKAGLEVDPTSGNYEDDGILSFKPAAAIEDFAAGALTYDVQNQYGPNPVWMTIEIDTGTAGNRGDNTVYQYVPATNPAGWHTVDGNAGEQWLKWATPTAGVPNGDPAVSLAQIAATFPGDEVIRVNLRLGMGNSYHPDENGTVGWVDKVVIGTTTYDFVVDAAETNNFTVTPASTDWGFVNDNGTTGDWSTGFESGPATPPIGVGSANIALNSDLAGIVLGTQKYQGTPLAAIEALSYSTYTNITPPAMTFQINYDPDVRNLEVNGLGNPLWYGRLTYEPYRNSTVTVGTWQTWDMLNGGAGKWWASGNASSPVDDVCGQNTPCTLTSLLTQFPYIGIRNDAASGIMFKAGSTWNGFDGNVDNLSIQIAGVLDVYDFEQLLDVYVDDDFIDPSCGGHVCGVDAFPTLQEGIAAVAAGGTVHIAGGTYPEIGQFVINKNLTIVGDDADKAVIQPTADLAADNAAGAWWLVQAGINFSLSDVVIDGAGYRVHQAIRNHGTATIDDVDFQDIVDSTNQYRGIAIESFGGTIPGAGSAGNDSHGAGGAASTLTVTNSTFTNIGRIGVLVKGSASTATITSNTYTGKGDGDWLDYAFELGAGGTATISGNTISGNTGVALSDGSTSAGILITTYWGPGTAGTITGNIISDNSTGVAIGYDGADTSDVTLTGNTFSGNDESIGSTAPGTFDMAAALSGNTFDGTVTVEHLGALLPNIWNNIQDGIDAAVAGDTVHVSAGTFVENVNVNKSVAIAGAGQASTIVMPAVSAPNPCNNSSLCGGAASNVFLVQANNVAIHDLTVDGDNPALTSGIVRGAADLDARNGIIRPGTYTGFEVDHVMVRNIYLRGIQAGTGTFSFHDNTLTNVNGEAQSIAIGVFFGSGLVQNNAISNSNDAIGANYSSGTQYLNNTITNSATGVHTDNNGVSGGVADVIQGNTVQDCTAGGYGVFVFNPKVNVAVNDNTITNCAVGLAMSGGVGGIPTFTDNTVDGQGLASSTGLYITTSLWGWGSANVNANFTSNIFINNTDSVYLESETGYTLTTTALHNQIYGSTNGSSLSGGGTYNANFDRNWWGSATGPGGIGPGSGDAIVAEYDYTYWCADAACTHYEPKTLIAPLGSLTSWVNSFTWTGVPNATYYIYEIYNSSDVRLFQKWYTLAEAGCDGDFSCAVSPGMTASLPVGDYHWRVRDYGAYGYGAWSAYGDFTLGGNVPVLGAPTGSINTWGNSYNWTGAGAATYYVFEIYNASDVRLLQQWYTNAAAGCDADTSCAISPATTANLPDGTYHWRARSYGAYGYSAWATYNYFTLTRACYTLTTSVAPAATGAINVTAQNCAGGYTPGTIVQLTAVPNAGYAFSNWSGDASGTVNPVSITMDTNKNVIANLALNMAVLGAPSGSLNAWTNSFNWTGLSPATYYILEIYNGGDVRMLQQWYSAAGAGCDGDTSCAVSPAMTASLPDGTNYHWRIRDYGAYGYGTWTPYTYFDLARACYTLTTSVAPAATGAISLTAQNCAGGYTPGTTVQLTAVPNAGYAFSSWSGDASGAVNPVSITMDANKSVTANLASNVVVLGAPVGDLTSWSNSYNWTGLPTATYYIFEIYNSSNVRMLQQWYPAAGASCDSDTSCVVSPAMTANLANGTYHWRVRDYGAYGYGTWTAYNYFTLTR